MRLEEYMEIRNGRTRQGTTVVALTSAEAKVMHLNTKVKGWYTINRKNEISEAEIGELKRLAVRDNRTQILDSCGSLLVKGKDKFVYLIRNSSYHYKIGISSSPNRRLKGLSTACSEKLTLIEFWEHPVKYSEVMEKELHEKYKHFRLLGEWFDFKGMTEKEILEEISLHFTPNSV